MVDRQFACCRGEDELALSVRHTQLLEELRDSPGDRKQVWNGAAAPTLPICQLKRPAFDVVVSPRHSQQLEESLTSKEDLAAYGVCDLEPLSLEALLQMPELGVIEHALARLLELADAGQKGNRVAGELEHCRIFGCPPRVEVRASAAR